MKLKISEITGKNGEPFLEPKDKINLFKHCSGGAVAIEVGKILPLIELIKMHGEEVDIPIVELPESKIYVRRSDGVRFQKGCDCYYRVSEDGKLLDQPFPKDKFNLIYFKPEGKIYD